MRNQGTPGIPSKPLLGAEVVVATGVALGMMLPGMWSGQLQEALGYQRFFVWVMIATVPSFLAVGLVPLDRRRS